MPEPTPSDKFIHAYGNRPEADNALWEYAQSLRALHLADTHGVFIWTRAVGTNRNRNTIYQWELWVGPHDDTEQRGEDNS